MKNKIRKKEIFEKAYLQKKLIESGVSSEILNNINDIIENKKQDTYNNIINKRIPFELVINKFILFLGE